MNANSSALALAAVRKSFGNTEIIRGVDLAIPKGERHAIIGPNKKPTPPMKAASSSRPAPPLRA